MGAHRLIPARRNVRVKAVFCALILLATSLTLARANAGAASAYSTVQPGTFTGYAFDACTAPSSATMKTWRASSPYKGIGIYIGGVSRGCTQANLTAAWVQEQVTAGWKLLPLYVGPQATCSSVVKAHVIDNANAYAQGSAAAGDAVTQAISLGLAKNSVLIYDMEAYNTADKVCRAGVLNFMNGWTSRLHNLGYFSGYYSSVSSGIADQVAQYTVPGYAKPDYIDFARWDQVVKTTDANIPAANWPGHRRMKQYRGGHTETYGGVTINIDNNYVDFAPLPSATMADFNTNGWSDFLAKDWRTSNIYLYPGNGAAAGGRTQVATGWKSYNAIIRIGDLNKDGKEDVIARATNGDLYFYPGTTTGFGSRKKLLGGTGALREITPVGDLTKDGYPDMVAIQGSTLYLYPGASGTKLAARKSLGSGWGTRSELAGIGDFNKDGYPDLVARDNSNATLYLHPGRKGTYAARVSIGAGWMGLRDLVGVGDFDRDGYTDLVAIKRTDGSLLLFRGNGKTLTSRTLISSFNYMSPLS
ncbi:glycoside hydrolase domain-containing protein [Actinoplanes sp. NPDC026619]|uniref:glycoside hydrolase domain-containing protein n=1 Tax=Actinoplanes sp. NPDC026619 TaxID=3155798 RepID=UPI00340DB6CB